MTTPEEQAKIDGSTLSINGKPFVLYHMSPEKGAELYSELAHLKDRDGKPTKTNYQEMADSMADFAMHCHSLIALSPDELKTLLKAIQDAGGDISKITDESVKKLLDTDAGKSFQNIIAEIGWGKATESLGSLLGLLNAVGDAGNGFIKAFKAPYKLATDGLGLVISGGDEALNMLNKPPSAGEAKTFGAAYAAAMYAQIDAPDAPAATGKPTAGIIDGVWARIQSVGDWIWRSGVGKYVSAFVSAVSAKFLGEHSEKSWSECWSEALVAAEKKRADEPELTYAQRLEQNLVAKVEPLARAQVSSVLKNSEKVGNIATDVLVQAIDKPGTYRDYDGTWNEVTFNHNKPEHKPILDKTGKVITAGGELKKKGNELINDVLPEASVGGVVGYTAGSMAVTGVAVTGAKDIQKGFANKYVGSPATGKETGPWKKAKDLMDEAKKIRTGTDGTKVAGKTLWGAKKPDPVKALTLEQQADDILEKAGKRAASYPKLSKLAGEANEAKGIFSRAYSWSMQKIGGGAARVANICGSLDEKAVNMFTRFADPKVEATMWGKRWAAYLNPLKYPKICYNNAAKCIGAFQEGMSGQAAAKSASALESVGTYLGRGLAWVGSKTGLSTEILTTGAEAVGKNGLLSTATSTVGGRVLPYLDTVISGVDAVASTAEAIIEGEGDFRQANTTVAKFGIIGSCTAIGASTGLLGGPLAPVTSTVGAVGGALVGTAIWFFSGDSIKNFFEGDAPPATAGAQAGNAGTGATQPDPGIAAAAIEAEKTRAAQDSVRQQRVAFNQSVSTAVGAVNPEFQMLTLGNAPRQAQGIH